MPSQLDELKAKREILELELLEHQINELQGNKARKKIAHEQVEHDLADAKTREKVRQDRCNHRKGGRDLDGIHGNGNSADYSVIKHRFANGDIHVFCQRCIKHWEPGTPGYAEAVALPTDNTMSEAVQFRFTKN